MGKIQSKDDFISMSRIAHGDRYSYDKVEFKNDHDKVVITCPIHGDFSQRPKHHIKGAGCRKCAAIKAHSSIYIYGVGINDVHNGKPPSYLVWHDMLRRCYGDEHKRPAYAQSSVCEDWLWLSKFDEWFYAPENGWRPHYQLDKDLLKKDNKVYSPETCCFLPQRINLALMMRKTKRTDLPVGVQRSGKGFVISCSCNPCSKTFYTVEEAFWEYKRRKESFIHRLAIHYYNKGDITTKVFNALMKWTVTILD